MMIKKGFLLAMAAFIMSTVLLIVSCSQNTLENTTWEGPTRVSHIQSGYTKYSETFSFSFGKNSCQVTAPNGGKSIWTYQISGDGNVVTMTDPSGAFGYRGSIVGNSMSIQRLAGEIVMAFELKRVR